MIKLSDFFFSAQKGAPLEPDLWFVMVKFYTIPRVKSMADTVGYARGVGGGKQCDAVTFKTRREANQWIKSRSHRYKRRQAVIEMNLYLDSLETELRAELRQVDVFKALLEGEKIP